LYNAPDRLFRLRGPNRTVFDSLPQPLRTRDRLRQLHRLLKVSSFPDASNQEPFRRVRLFTRNGFDDRAPDHVLRKASPISDLPLTYCPIVVGRAGIIILGVQVLSAHDWCLLDSGRRADLPLLFRSRILKSSIRLPDLTARQGSAAARRRERSGPRRLRRPLDFLPKLKATFPPMTDSARRFS
jgi:hypothetical protein